jgi:hypothetical protein
MYQASLKDRIICAFLYSGVFLSFVNWIPLVWIIVAAIRKQYLPDFVKYHCYQAILFNMILGFLPELIKLLVSFTGNFLNLFGIFTKIIQYLNSFTNWFLGVYFIFIQILAVYAIVWTLRGRYTYVPPISQAINLLLR